VFAVSDSAIVPGVDGVLVGHGHADIRFAGLPTDMYCDKRNTRGFGGCPFRLAGQATVRLPSGAVMQTASVFIGGRDQYATSLVAYRSTDADATQFEYLSTIVHAGDSSGKPSEEGPGAEHDCALLGDNSTILCVMRIDAGDGPETHPYRFYQQVTSTSEGRTWSAPEEMPGLGCARPRLLVLGDTVLLSGGRRRLPPFHTTDVDLLDQPRGRALRHLAALLRQRAAQPAGAERDATLWSGGEFDQRPAADELLHGADEDRRALCAAHVRARRARAAHGLRDAHRRVKTKRQRRVHYSHPTENMDEL